MPTPINLYAAAKGYVQAAKMVTESPHFAGSNTYAVFLPHQMLLAFASELYLKAFLQHSGVNPTQLKSFDLRHDLDALYRTARERGLPASSGMAHLIDAMSEHHKGHHYRYMPDDAQYAVVGHHEAYPALDWLDDFVDEAIGASASRGLAVGRYGHPTSAPHAEQQVRSAGCDE